MYIANAYRTLGLAFPTSSANNTSKKPPILNQLHKNQATRKTTSKRKLQTNPFEGNILPKLRTA